MRHDVARQWIGAIYSEDLDLVSEMLDEQPDLANSVFHEFDDPFRETRFPVATLLFAVNGPPYQQLPWTAVERRISFDLVELLLDRGADPNVFSIHGLPLCWTRDRQVAELLIHHGGDINRWHQNGGSPLYFSLWQQDIERLQLQLSLGADPNRFSPDAGSPMHMAADLEDTSEEFKLRSLQVLLEHGANPNLQCSVSAIPQTDQNTPLHLAAARASPAVVKLLLEFGADPSIPNRMGVTPRVAAGMSNRPASVRDLLC